MKRQRKYWLAKLLTWRLGIKPQRIVISSTGRAGSTMLFDAVVDAYAYSCSNVLGRLFLKLTRRAISGFLDRIRDIRRAGGLVFKTHDQCPERCSDDVKYVFVFGDPLESILSVDKVVEKNGISWFYRHQYHLVASGRFEDRYQKDVMNFEGQVRSWMKERRSDIFTVRYEELWIKKAYIEEFLGFPLTFPEQQERSKKICPIEVNVDLFTKLSETAESLYKK